MSKSGTSFPNRPVTRTNRIGASALTDPNINLLGNPLVEQLKLDAEARKQKQDEQWKGYAALLGGMAMQSPLGAPIMNALSGPLGMFGF